MPRFAQTLFGTLAAALLAVALGGAAQAELAKPEGTIILTVSGAITEKNDGDTAVFDLAMLRALPSETITTTTIWTAGKQSFTGVSLKTLLETLGATGQTLNSIAINDYQVKIPAEDATENGPIIAYELNGNTMSVREKGPLWVVYPYDSASHYRTEVIYSRSIWQLDRIEITD